MERSGKILESKLGIDDILEWKSSAIGHDEIERHNQMARMVIVHAAHSDAAFDQHIGINCYISVGIDQTGDYVAAADPQHLQTLRKDLRRAAYLDHHIGAVRRAKRPDLLDQ